MDRDTAQRVLEAMSQIDVGFHAAFVALKEAGEDLPQNHRLKKRLAMLLALLGSGVYRPLYHEHPDLCPDPMRFMLDRPPQAADWPFKD
jgi:hypothetical protein